MQQPRGAEPWPTIRGWTNCLRRSATPGVRRKRFAAIAPSCCRRFAGAGWRCALSSAARCAVSGDGVRPRLGRRIGAGRLRILRRTRPWTCGGMDARGVPTADASDELPQGDPPMIGRYRIVRRLGQGGFGRVYLARDDDLDRPVAIKVPSPERVSGPDDVEQYLARGPRPGPARPPAHRPGPRRGPHRGRPLLRRLQVRRGERPGRAEATGPVVVPRVGRAGGGGRRGAAPCPHPGPGPPRHQAGQHPDRSPRASRGWPTSGWRCGTRTTARRPSSSARPRT